MFAPSGRIQSYDRYCSRNCVLAKLVKVVFEKYNLNEGEERCIARLKIFVGVRSIEGKSKMSELWMRSCQMQLKLKANCRMNVCHQAELSPE